MIVSDASVWVSLLRPQDSSHIISSSWLRQWTDEGNDVSVPTIFLAEVGGAIARLTGSSALSRRAILDILGEPNLHHVAIDQLLGELSATLAADIHLRGADAIYVALASRLNVPLITWDREQLTRAAAIIDVRQPSV